MPKPRRPRLSRLVPRVRRKTGLPPGTLVYTGRERAEPAGLRVITYGPDEIAEHELDPDGELDFARFRSPDTFLWINVDGVHNVDVLQQIGDEFGLHPLVLEDIARTGQRPKQEEHEGLLFMVVKMLSYDDVDDQVLQEQMSIVLGEGWVLSFQERRGDVFDPIRQRLRAPQTRTRYLNGSDYLAYRLLDTIVDHYFIVMEKIGDRVEELEAEELLGEAKPDMVRKIHGLKRETILLRKAVWPLREVLFQLERGEPGGFSESTRVYLRDVYDHAIEVIDTIETLRDLTSGILDVHLTNVSNSMNEVMKVLTVIATIFVPLTFVAGVYGMNFTNMPELTFSWGYPAALAVMAAIAIVMLGFFRRKGWL